MTHKQAPIHFFFFKQLLHTKLLCTVLSRKRFLLKNLSAQSPDLSPTQHLWVAVSHILSASVMLLLLSGSKSLQV